MEHTTWIIYPTIFRNPDNSHNEVTSSNKFLSHTIHTRVHSLTTHQARLSVRPHNPLMVWPVWAWKWIPLSRSVRKWAYCCTRKGSGRGNVILPRGNDCAKHVDLQAWERSEHHVPQHASHSQTTCVLRRTPNSNISTFLRTVYVQMVSLKWTNSCQLNHTGWCMWRKNEWPKAMDKNVATE